MQQQQTRFENDRPSPNCKAEEVRHTGGVFYDLPPGRATKVDGAGCADDSFYNTPSSQHMTMNKSHVQVEDQSTVIAVDDGGCYDVPPSGSKVGVGKRPSKKLDKKSAGKVVEDELYNVPKNELDKEKQGRIWKSGADVSHEMWSDTTATASDELYNVPRVQNDVGRDRKVTNVSSKVVIESDEVYNVPREQLHGRGKTSNKEINAPTSTVDELYNIPREQIGSGGVNEKSVKGTPLSTNTGQLYSNMPLTGHAVAEQTYEIPPVKHSPQNRVPAVKERAEPKKSVTVGQIHVASNNVADDTYNIPLSSQNHVHLQHDLLKLSLSHGTSIEPGDQTYDIPPQSIVSSSKLQNNDLSKVYPGQPNNSTVSDETYDIPSKIPPVPAKKNTPAPPKPPRPEQGSVVIKPLTGNVSLEMKADLRGSVCGFVVSESSLTQKEQDYHAASKSEDVEKDTMGELNTGSSKSKFSSIFSTNYIIY